VLGATNRSARTARIHRRNPDHFGGVLGRRDAGQNRPESSIDPTPDAGMVMCRGGSAQDLRRILVAEVALWPSASIQGAMAAQIVAKPQVTEEVI